MSKWKEYSIGDLGEVITGKTPPAKTTGAYGDGIPFITPRDMDGRKWIDTTERYLSDNGLAVVKNSLVPSGSVSVSCIGSDMGKVVMVPSPSVTNQQINTVVVDEEKFNAEFVYYNLSVRQDELKSIASGSATPILNKGHFSNVKLSLPPKEEQDSIVEILQSIDNKIELNRQTNQTLEQIAQAIFKSWFVDFDPVKAKIQAKQTLTPTLSQREREQIVERAAMCAISGKSLEELEQLSPETQQQLKTTAALFPDALVESELGEIPEGWEVTELDELLEFNPRRVLKKGMSAPYLDMKNVPTEGHLANDVSLREMSSGTKFTNGDTLLARITPCLENGKTAYVDFLEKDQIGWGSTEYIIMRPRNGRPMSLGYMIARLDSFRSKAIQTMTGTSGRQRANAKALSEQIWIDYPINLLKVFDLVAGSYLDKARINGSENKTLCVIRDALLPKLLSGALLVEPPQAKLEGKYDKYTPQG